MGTYCSLATTVAAAAAQHILSLKLHFPRKTSSAQISLRKDLNLGPFCKPTNVVMFAVIRFKFPG